MIFDDYVYVCLNLFKTNKNKIQNYRYIPTIIASHKQRLFILIGLIEQLQYQQKEHEKIALKKYKQKKVKKKGQS